MRSRPARLAFLLATHAFSQTASLASFSDRGVFHLYVNEERVASLNFDWKPDGYYCGRIAVTLGGQTATFSTTLTPDADGRWVKAVIEGSDGTFTWRRDGNSVQFETPSLSGQGTFPKDILAFEPYSPSLITPALLRYDKKTGGKQILLAISLDAHLVGSPAVTVERQDSFDVSINGKTLHLTRWLFAPAGREFHALADDAGRIYLLSGIPGIGGGVSPRNIYFVRESYESLRAPPRDSEPLSQPQYRVELRSSVKLPMRDGILLATDFYLPAGVPKSPVILIRTPYMKEMEELSARFYARRGYVVAVQDVRGRFASEGVWEPFVHEAQDGYDTIEWLARQPWSTGKIGMIGASYVGWVQWWAASLHPPHLAAMIPNVSPPDPLLNLPYDHGVFSLANSSRWVSMVETNAAGDVSGEKTRAVDQKDASQLLQPLPVSHLDVSFLGKVSNYWRDWCNHPARDGYWMNRSFLDKLNNLTVPVFHESGWYDADGIGTKLNYLRLAASGHAIQKMTIGPWGHTDTAEQSSDTQDYGPAAAIDLQRDYLRWFDHWLKGIDNSIVNEPLVSLYVMGSNRWLHGPTYPLPGTRYEKLYLAGGARLTFQRPTVNQPGDHYTYDPGHPTPSPAFDSAGPESVAARDDILIYTSDPFEKPYTIAGPVRAVLFAATSARDTDWFVYLVDLNPAGKATSLWGNGSGGRLRARFRNSLSKPELVTPRKIYRYDIDLWHTAITIAPGHRLRVEVASAEFPDFDRNLNTGGNNETETQFVAARQTIYHDAAHASYVLLPRVE